jgi:hypothetical protein
MKVWLFVVMALLATADAPGQDSPFILGTAGRPMIRPDGTYVFNHAPRSDLVFEAQLAPRIIILDSIGSARQKVLDQEGGASGWTLAATPMVKLRMFDEASNPVRTPSYMPKAIVQFARLKNLSNAEEETERFKGPVAIWLLDTIPFGHHSNGQNGCVFTSQSKDADGGCLDPPSPALPTTINKIDGSFSTNYVEATVAYGRMHLEPRDEVQEYGTKWEWRAGFGVQLNPRGYLGGAIDDELADIYGRTRFSAEAMAARRDEWRCGRLEGQIRLQYIRDTPEDVPPITTIAEASCLPARWGGAGLFVRFYRGQDYYNLGFAASITRLQFGITLQQATFLSFRIPAL